MSSAADARPFRIIADDLTGAADAVASFASDARPVPVLIDPAPLWRDVAVGVVSIDAGTRALEARSARETITNLMQKLPGNVRLIKKIDSLLRGNVGVEFAAAREARRDSIFVVAPAFPQLGRTTRDGIQHLLGAPIGNVAERLDTSALKLSVEEVRRAFGELDTPEAIGAETIICDAETDEDLDAIVRFGEVARKPIVWVGSGGLAAAHARRYHDHLGTTAAGPSRLLATRHDVGRVLLVVGSESDEARRQALAVLRAFEATHLEVPSSKGEPGDLGESRLTVVTVSREREELAVVVEQALAKTAAHEARNATALILTGGATARAVLSHLGVKQLVVHAALEPGIVLSRTPMLQAWIVTKAGTFGDEQALVRAVQFIREAERGA